MKLTSRCVFLLLSLLSRTTVEAVKKPNECLKATVAVLKERGNPPADDPTSETAKAYCEYIAKHTANDATGIMCVPRDGSAKPSNCMARIALDKTVATARTTLQLRNSPVLGEKSAESVSLDARTS